MLREGISGGVGAYIHSTYIHKRAWVLFFSFVDIYLYESGPPPNKHTHTRARWRSDNCPSEVSRGGGPRPINCRYLVPSPVIRFPRRTVPTRDGYPNTASAGVSIKDKIWALSITLSFPNRAGVHAKIRSHPREDRGLEARFFLLVRVSAEVRPVPRILVTQRDIPHVLRHKNQY